MNVKLKFLLFFLIFTKNLFAYDGIVIVHEASLLKEAKLSSKVVQTIRKGERVYIPREFVRNGILPEFVPTFDRTGNRAYLLGKYVKVILGTDKESRTPITLTSGDPTDYRLEEPIPSSYPYENYSFLRAAISFNVANNNKSPYSYNAAFREQEYRSELGSRLTITKKVDHDKYDRFYFGLIGLITSSKNTIMFKNNGTARESRDLIRVGPWLTYDAYKSEKYRLTFGTGFTYNFHRTTLFADSGQSSEQRFFSGKSIAPMLSSNFQLSDVLPYTDFIAGMDLSLFLPHTISDTAEVVVPELWGESNQIASGLKAQASIFLGLQVKY
jgi:hypothetical protein